MLTGLLMLLLLRGLPVLLLLLRGLLRRTPMLGGPPLRLLLLL